MSISNKKSIIISGHSGFVGKNVINYFSNLDYNIQKISLRDDDWKSRICGNYRAIIHAAGIASDSLNIELNEYIKINADLTLKFYNYFLNSDVKDFIYLSSVKSVTDSLDGVLDEERAQHPSSSYGISKMCAENYLLSKKLSLGKRLFILRPCMIHGKGNMGNISTLYKLISMGFPWPLGAYENVRSFCNIDNLLFVFKELIEREEIPSGVYNVADDVPLSTNEVISILAESLKRNPRIWNISKDWIEFIAKVGDVFKLPLNMKRLHKLTDSYVVSNNKLMCAIGKPLPFSSSEGLLKTFQSFQ
jgi:nucleoside-diphosphate-sugar epimerase